MKGKILVIEDENVTRKYITQALQDVGFEVEGAADGNEGIAKLRRQNFDLIVLDLKMPGKSGQETLLEIRQISPFVEVVVFTNCPLPEVMETLINLGVDGFLKKGANADLFQIVRMVEARLRPMDDQERKNILREMFNKLGNTSGNAVFC